ncbi:MAG: FMN-dependent NADH-azoreductase [Henriciella sp.]|nr:NAD(P)H-dependent oxidoreductase [Hyphomonadaceae bacterium]
MARNILHIDASARSEGSVTRALSQKLVDTLSGDETQIVKRDIGLTPLPILTEDWVGANFTPDETRSPDQIETLKLSDQLIAEIQAADTLVLGVPIYNFGVPATFKAWIDLIARARKTFKYTDNGPVGLLEGKRAFVVIASGGTASGSEIDFATPYVRHVLGFLGIHDVTTYAADQLMVTGDANIIAAQQQIDALAA